jgi:hypothetical protein
MDRLMSVVTILQGWGATLAILSLTVLVILYLLEPILPDWVNERRGSGVRVILALIALGMIPDFVSFFTSL